MAPFEQAILNMLIFRGSECKFVTIRLVLILKIFTLNILINIFHNLKFLR